MTAVVSHITSVSLVQAQIKTSKLRANGLCEGNPPMTGGFPSQRASDAWKSFHLMTSACPRNIAGCWASLSNTTWTSLRLAINFMADGDLGASELKHQQEWHWHAFIFPKISGPCKLFLLESNTQIYLTSRLSGLAITHYMLSIFVSQIIFKFKSLMIVANISEFSSILSLIS